MTRGQSRPETIRDELSTPSRERLLEARDCPRDVALELARRFVDDRLGPVTAFRQISDLGVLSETISRSIAHVQDVSVFCDGGTPNPQTTAGSGFGQAAADLRTLGEAIERYCLAAYDTAGFLYQRVGEPNEATLAPAVFDKRSPADRQDAGTSEELPWTMGTALQTGEPTLLPAALVYLPFEPLPQCPPTSTGAAAGTGYASACLRAVCEVVEREAIAVGFYNRVPFPRVDRSTVPDRVRRLLDRVETGQRQVHLLDATFDAPFPTVLALVTDLEHRPAVSLGANCAVRGERAVEGAILEALQSREYGRDVVRGTDRSVDRPITTLEDRAVFWADPERLEDITCWTSGDSVVPLHSGESGSGDRDSASTALSSFIQYLRERDLRCPIVDITTPDVAECGFRVVKAVGVEFHPLPLDERRQMFGGDRLHRLPITHGPLEAPPVVQERIPHPFV